MENDARDRCFYKLPNFDTSISEENRKSRTPELIKYISENIIGRRKVFSGPFGLRSELYLDYTASGKSLKFLEDYIENEVLTEYGNTHTTTSVSSLQTTLYRHEARDIIRNAVHASEHDAVIFVGSGTTGAVHKLIHSLNLTQAPVVFVGPYEHHSNLLPWMETGAKVIRVRTDSQGLVDVGHLQTLLQKWKRTNRQLIGCFSAASNVTGTLVDVDSINVCLHKHGALAFWDYATAAPYVPVDMNPVSASIDQPYMYKDAIFLSPHKFVGGVQTPGILVAKKNLFRNQVPDGCGGGSVFYVRREGHRYLQEPEMKEEGGTPAIVEAVRAGLVFQLKEAVTSELIMKREQAMLDKAKTAWADSSSLVILGNQDVERLPIFSFLVYHGQSGKYLHHNYVSTLLNDLFGIQSRGGCACAGPYAMDLLGMEENVSQKIEEILAEDSRLDRTHLRRYREYSQREIIRPGFTRLNLPYFLDEDDIDFVLEAVRLVAEEGWKLLPQYVFNPETGEWRQVNFQVFKDRKWLGHISYKTGEMTYKVPLPLVKGPLPENYKECLQKARDLFAQASKSRYQLADHTVMFDEAVKPLRWFLLPSEAADCLTGTFTRDSNQLPFCPPQHRQSVGLPEFIGTSDNGDCDIADFILSTEPDRCSSTSQHSQEDANSAKSSKNVSGTVSTEKNPVNGSKYQSKSSGTYSQAHLDTKTVLASENLHRTNQSESKDNSQAKHTQETALCNKSNAINGDTQEVREEKMVVLRDGGVSDSLSNKLGTDSKREEGAECKMVDSDQTVKTVREGNDSVSYRLGTDSNSEHGAESKMEDSDHTVKTVREGNYSVSNIGTNSYREHGAESKMEDSDHTVKTVREGNDSISNGLGTDSNGEHGVESKMEDKNQTVRTVREDSTMDSDADSAVDNETRKRKKTGEEAQEIAKRSRDKEDDGHEQKEKLKASKWYSPPKTIFAPFLKAVEEYNMICNGDKVLVCLSGGKDSLSLLHSIRQYQFYAKKKGIQFEIGAVTVDPETPSYDPSPLKQYLGSLGVPYFYESQGILDQASNLPYECASICSFCSRMKRGRIYACARREGYNVLALGQHLDDLCESFLMSIFHNGLLRTMKACYTVEEGDLRVTRPFVYVREKDLRSFAEKNKLPVIAENCPACFEAPKERHRTKQLLASQEILFPRIFNSLMSAIRPIMAINKTGVKISDFLQQDLPHDDIDI